MASLRREEDPETAKRRGQKGSRIKKSSGKKVLSGQGASADRTRRPREKG